MAIIRPFSAIRPREDLVSKVAALPYDVYNRKEAFEVVKNNPLSFLKIDRAEVQFDDSVSTYDDRVYDRARDTLDEMITENIFNQDETECYYIYELTMNGRSQTGLVACASIDDYLNNVIKKHEKTREDKEIDRINHVDRCNAHTGPIFLAYSAREEIDNIINQEKTKQSLYKFVSDDGIGHVVWKIDSEEKINQIKTIFSGISDIYIADGHHRAASAVKVGIKRRSENPNYNGNEEFNYFLSVLFPHNQLMIMPYNRVVRDLNGYSKEEFIKEVSKDFVITNIGNEKYNPTEKATYGMYLDEEWYRLVAKEEIISDNPVDNLDVSILQNHLLKPILNILDPRTETRIDFVGGIRGLEELERRVNSDMVVAFSMYPTSIEELFAVSDANELMPPKSTWFEPKLRSGLFIHKLT